MRNQSSYALLSFLPRKVVLFSIKCLGYSFCAEKQRKTHCFAIPVQRMLKDKKFTPPDIKSITLLNVFLLKALGNKIFISYFRKFLQGECSKTTTWKLVAEEKPLTSDDWQKTEFSMGSSRFQTQAWGGDDCQIQSWSFPTN